MNTNSTEKVVQLGNTPDISEIWIGSQSVTVTKDQYLILCDISTKHELQLADGSFIDNIPDMTDRATALANMSRHEESNALIRDKYDEIEFDRILTVDSGFNLRTDVGDLSFVNKLYVDGHVSAAGFAKLQLQMNNIQFVEPFDAYYEVSLGYGMDWVTAIYELAKDSTYYLTDTDYFMMKILTATNDEQLRFITDVVANCMAVSSLAAYKLLHSVDNLTNTLKYALCGWAIGAILGEYTLQDDIAEKISKDEFTEKVIGAVAICREQYVPLTKVYVNVDIMEVLLTNDLIKQDEYECLIMNTPELTYLARILDRFKPITSNIMVYAEEMAQTLVPYLLKLELFETKSFVSPAGLVYLHELSKISDSSQGETVSVTLSEWEQLDYVKEALCCGGGTTLTEEAVIADEIYIMYEKIVKIVQG